MPDILVDGTYKLNGSITVQGSKNAVLPIIAASVLCDGISVIKNCPDLLDVKASIKILSNLGAKCDFDDGVLTIDSRNISDSRIPNCLMREMRSSSLFLGAILGRMGSAEISSPGGCELGPRPIDIHIKALSELGAKVSDKNGCISIDSDGGLSGSKIHLSFPSVGATENTILASVTAKGETEIFNAAKEPEIIDLANFLNKAGANIKGAGGDRITIKGVKKLSGVEHSIIPDRIVASTYISAVASAGGDVELKRVNSADLQSVISCFREMGLIIEEKQNNIRIKSYNRLKSIETVRTQTYPGFPTDAGPVLISALTKSIGTTVFVENIFSNRFRYIDEIKRFGANIKTEGKVAIVEGVSELNSAECECTDLRGGAALVVSAVGANGRSVIKRIEHIKRGYEDIVKDLSLLGAHILYI